MQGLFYFKIKNVIFLIYFAKKGEKVSLTELSSN